jgi:oligopeptidase B
VPVDCALIPPARPDTRLLSCDVIGDRLLLTLRRGGNQVLASTDFGGGQAIEVSAGPAAGSISVEHAEDYEAGSVIVAEQSLIEPPAWYRLDLATGRRGLLKRQEVPGYDPGRYVTERVTARARDGETIPVTLAYSRATRLDGSAPCLLYGYGAYEDCSDPEFNVGLASLLDRGVVYAIAHIRGGGERGRTWWQQGRLRSSGRRSLTHRRRGLAGTGTAPRGFRGRPPAALRWWTVPLGLARAVGGRPAAGRGLLDAAGPVARRGSRGAVPWTA